ncbi:MAG: hypothetical protein ACR2PH_03230 [Desulfobulbia bacterium]
MVELGKLNLKGRFVVVGGGAMAVRGLRDAHDLDIVADEKCWADLLARPPPDTMVVQKNYLQNIGGVIVPHPDIQVFDRLAVRNDLGSETPRIYMEPFEQLYERALVINGVRFQTLESLVAMKEVMDRPKDKEDTALLKRIIEWGNAPW